MKDLHSFYGFWWNSFWTFVGIVLLQMTFIVASSLNKEHFWNHNAVVFLLFVQSHFQKVWIWWQHVCKTALWKLPRLMQPIPSEMPDPPSPLQSAGHTVHAFRREVHIFNHLTTEQFSTFPQTRQLSFRPEKTMVFLDHVDIWLLLCIIEL